MKLAWLVWPLLFGALAVFMAHHPMILSGLKQVQTDPGDPRLINYLLEHTYRIFALKPGCTGFWEMPFLFPHRNVGAYTDVVLTVSPPYLLFRLIGCEPDTAFQLWMMAVTALNFLAFYVFLRRCLPMGAPAASLGAALFAAGSSRVHQVGHLQLLCVAFVVLALAALSRLLAEDVSEAGARNPRAGRKTVLWLSLLFAAGVAQCWAGFYNAFFLAFMLTLAAIVLPFLPQLRRRMARLLAGHWCLVLGLGLAACLALLPLFLHWRAAAGELGLRPWWEVCRMLPRPQSWFNMGADSLLYGRLAGQRLFADIPAANEQSIGIGFLTPLAALVGLLIWRRKEWVKLLLAVSALVVVLTTLWMGKYTLWRVVYDFYPAAGAIRAVARAGIFMLIPAAMGLAVLVETGWRSRTWLVMLIAMACLLEQARTTPSFDKYNTRSDVAEVAALVGRDRKAFYLTACNTSVPEWQINMDAVWAAAVTGAPTVNGLTGLWPATYGRLFWSVLPDRKEELRVEADLQRWATVHGMKREDICWIRYDGSARLRREPYVSKVLKVDCPESAHCGETLLATVRIENAGTARWSPSDQPPPVIGGRLMRPDPHGRWETVVECRMPLVAPVAPSEILDATLKMRIPDVPPGEYILSVNMLKEGRFWFEDKGSPAFKRELTVAKPGNPVASPVNPSFPMTDRNDGAIP